MKLNAALRRMIRDAADQIHEDDLLRLDSLSSVETASNGQHYDRRDQVEAARRRITDFASRIADGDTAKKVFWRDDGRGRRVCDAQGLLQFAREVEFVMTEVEREEFADLRMANGEIVPINTSVPEGASTYTYYMLSAVGMARFLADYATSNIPTVDVQRVRVTGQIQPFATSYYWTTQQAREFAYSGFPLESELALAARRAVDQLINDTGLFGVPSLGLPGLLTHPNINRTPVALNAGATSTLWTDKTPDEVIADVNTVITTVDEVTFGKEKVNKVLMSRRAWNYLATTRLATATEGNTVTILGYLETIWGSARNGRPAVQFEVLDELTAENSFYDGVQFFQQDAMFAYTAGNRRKAELILPMPFQQSAVEQRELRFWVYVEGSSGGLRMPFPLMANLSEGIFEAP